MEIGCMLKLCSFLFLTTSSDQPPINDRLIFVKSMFFYFVSKLFVMSCQESTSSKKCIRPLVPTLHFTSQYDHYTTGVLCLNLSSFFCYSSYNLSKTMRKNVFVRKQKSPQEAQEGWPYLRQSLQG